MMAIRIRPGVGKIRPMSRTCNVRKAEWNPTRGTHHGQQQMRCENRPDTRLHLTPDRKASKNPCKAGAIHTRRFGWVRVMSALPPKVDAVQIAGKSPACAIKLYYW